MFQYLRNHFFGVGDGVPFEFLLFLFAFDFDFDLVPEAGFVADGEGAVLGAFGDHPFGPYAVGEVGPVVVAVFELLPGVFEDFLPGLVAEVFPEGGGGDLDAVVEVGLPVFGNGFEGALQGAEFFLEGGELFSSVSWAELRLGSLARRARSLATLSSLVLMRLMQRRRVWSSRRW